MVPAHGRISSTKEIAAIRAATGDMKHRRHEALMCGSIQLSLASHRVLEWTLASIERSFALGHGDRRCGMRNGTWNGTRYTTMMCIWSFSNFNSTDSCSGDAAYICRWCNDQHVLKWNLNFCFQTQHTFHLKIAISSWSNTLIHKSPFPPFMTMNDPGNQHVDFPIANHRRSCLLTLTIFWLLKIPISMNMTYVPWSSYIVYITISSGMVIPLS